MHKEIYKATLLIIAFMLTVGNNIEAKYYTSNDAQALEALLECERASTSGFSYDEACVKKVRQQFADKIEETSEYIPKNITYTATNAKAKKALDACKTVSTSGISLDYNCVDKVKKEYPGKIQSIIE